MATLWPDEESKQRALEIDQSGNVRTVGRPSGYSSEILDKANKYLADCKSGKMIPYIEELASELDVSRDTVYEWEKVHPEFSDTIKKIKDYQSLRLMQEGVGNRSNPAVTIFILKAKHGFIETTQQIVDGNYNINVDELVGQPPAPTQTAGSTQAAIESSD